MAKNTVYPDHEALGAIVVGNCVGLSAEEVDAYDSTEKMMSHRSFREHFTRAEYNALSEEFKYEIDPRAGLTMKEDWHVSYGWGWLNGKKVVCLHHSSIHYFYLARSERDQ